MTAPPRSGGVGSPGAFAARDWASIAARTIQRTAADDYGIVAASIAFAAFLSLLPLLSLVALSYSAIVPRAVVVGNIDTLIGILPDHAQAFVGHWLAHSMARHGRTFFAVLISALLTLFSGRRVGRSLIHAINIATDIDQDRSMVGQQLVALAIVLAGFVLMLAALISLSALAIVGHAASGSVPKLELLLHLILWLSLTAGPFAALWLTYRYAPARKPIAWRWALPGTVLALASWLAATLAFTAYVRHVASYGSTYGSLAAIVVIQLWLMLSAFLFLVGARFNAEALRQSGVDPDCEDD